MSSDDNTNLLRILLDTASLKSESSKVLLNYSDNELFEFVSLGKSAKHTEAQIVLDSQKDVNEIIIDKSKNRLMGYKKHLGFFYKISDIQTLAKHFDIEYDDLIIVYILSILAGARNQKTILVTERRKLLNRLNWKNSFPKLPINSIFHPDEANIFIDLYCKSKNKYLFAPNFYMNKGMWYLHSMKSKLPNFQLPWSIVVFADNEIPYKQELMEIIESLGSRVTDMLIAIDEIGNNYYAGVNNDTLDSIIYHFNYWTTLYTGVLDSLAWISKYRYQVVYDKLERIGLRKNRHKDFLNLVFAKNNQISDFLDKNTSAVSLMYEPRDLIIHRNRLRGLTFDNRNENFYFNMVRIPEIFFKKIVELSKEKGDNLGKWGHIKSHGDYFLEPFSFVKKATSKLIEFVNGYLDLLKFEEYLSIFPELKTKIENSNKKDSHRSFLQDIDKFVNFKLGY
jgi:hypothetical protein